MATVTITDEGARCRVAFPYDAELVALVKDVVPGYSRSYDSSTKSWFVEKRFHDELTTAIVKAGHTVGAAATKAAARPKLEPGTFWAPEDGFDEAAVAAEFLAGIDRNYHGRVFRAMAKQLYPDLYVSKR